MFKSHLFIFLLLIAQQVYSQNPAFSKLEMYYAQGHYKKVYRQSNLLLDKPEYDYSNIPRYYKALSSFQLVVNKRWYKRHQDEVESAISFYKKFQTTNLGSDILKKHKHELLALKHDLNHTIELNKQFGKTKTVQRLEHLVQNLFQGTPILAPSESGVVKHNDASQDKQKENFIDVNNNTDEASSNLSQRNEIVVYAKQQLGVNYKYGGTTPSGFDCSGFSAYVFNHFNKSIPRISKNQYVESKKIKRKDAQVGDLVFFSNGGGVNHVGIIISEKGAPLQMIHASTSAGIVITNIDESTYWSKRLKGFGTFVE